MSKKMNEDAVLEAISQEFRDERSLELYDKVESMLNVGEETRLQEYIDDWLHPVWKVVDAGFGIKVEVNQTGTAVRDPVTKKNYHIAFTRHKDGRHNYLFIVIRRPDTKKTVPKLVHQLVAIAFVDNPENKPEVNHIDGNKWNAWYRNLEWVTDSENKIHAFRSGLAPSHAGEKSPVAKYTSEQIVEVCNLLESEPKMTFKQIASLTGVSAGTVKSVYFKQNWTTISKDYNFPARETQVRGEKSHLAKTMESSIEKVCCLLDEVYLGKSNLNHQQISEMAGVSKSVVDNVSAGKSWNNVVEKHVFSTGVKSKKEVISNE